jgi:hypothetical protein
LISLLDYFTKKGKQNRSAWNDSRDGKENGRFLYRTEARNRHVMDVFIACHESRDPAQGRFRYKRLEAGTDLLGAWLVDVIYGRIGTRGRHVRYVVENQDAARKVVRDRLRRRATARKRIGVSYRFRELRDPHQWCPFALE